ncbi:MAG TPA: A24 family peptidase [Bacillota bacterium]|nr:A24 family peptidase [Clostridiaceae bacterium]HNR04135.1 A24 family peptidase [Bacillota bacterium]HNT02762.1 A24 family peptidase [Bacillota bacterium]HPA54014.1 A24 family peptidase [Bacillota bacterium]HQO41591.1 A24 family peptidase [Bacillota bacterium]
MIAIVFKLIIVSMLMLLALVSDFRTYSVKNYITYGFMLIGLAVNLAIEGIGGLVFSLQGIIIPAACLFVLYITRIVGAGDIKLLCAVGAVMGAAFALYAAIYSFIFGGFIASGLMLTRENASERFNHLFVYLKSCFLTMDILQYTDLKNRQDGGKFHFSIAIASGTAAAIIMRGV